MQRTAEMKLAFLERHPDGIYEFAVSQTNERFDRLIEAMSLTHRYAIKTVYYTAGSGHYKHGKGYQANEEGMWLLSHLFSNYTEMDERLSSSRKQDFLTRTCFSCHKKTAEVWRCSLCHEPFCLECSPGHTHAYDWRKRQEDRRAQEEAPKEPPLFFCEACETPCFARYDCLHCGKRLCPLCHSVHQARTNPYKGFGRESTSGTTTGSFDAWTFNAGQSAFRREMFDEFTNWQFDSSKGSTQQNPGASQQTGTPDSVRAAFSELGIPPTPDAEKIKQAFRSKVRASATGDGGYTGDMDRLTKAKEAALAYTQGK